MRSHSYASMAMSGVGGGHWNRWGGAGGAAGGGGSTTGGFMKRGTLQPSKQSSTHGVSGRDSTLYDEGAESPPPPLPRARPAGANRISFGSGCPAAAGSPLSLRDSGPLAVARSPGSAADQVGPLPPATSRGSVAPLPTAESRGSSKVAGPLSTSGSRGSMIKLTGTDDATLVALWFDAEKIVAASQEKPFAHDGAQLPGTAQEAAPAPAPQAGPRASGALVQWRTNPLQEEAAPGGAAAAAGAADVQAAANSSGRLPVRSDGGVTPSTKTLTRTTEGDGVAPVAHASPRSSRGAEDSCGEPTTGSSTRGGAAAANAERPRRGSVRRISTSSAAGGVLIDRFHNDVIDQLVEEHLRKRSTIEQQQKRSSIERSTVDNFGGKPLSEAEEDGKEEEKPLAGHLRRFAGSSLRRRTEDVVRPRHASVLYVACGRRMGAAVRCEEIESESANFIAGIHHRRRRHR